MRVHKTFAMGATDWRAVLTVYMTAITCLSSEVLPAAPKEVEEYACFNTVFEITCAEQEVIIFDSARYGRNDTQVATKCNVPYQRNCDIDVHFLLNGVCAGKERCSLAVNTALFKDPCGYEEFLKVTYRCVPVSTLHQSCSGTGQPPLYDHGFIGSPNYPGYYYMDADCLWTLSVQKRQSIQVTILDFALDVKRGGRCHDFLEISSGRRVFFKDCGGLGKQVIGVDSSDAVVRFKTGHGSLTQRGFLIFFEALGPGCPDIENLDNGLIEYYIEEDTLYANASCVNGYAFSGTDLAFQQIACSGSYWDSILTPCIAPPNPTLQPPVTTNNIRPKGNTSVIDKSGSLIGIALGVVSAILLITLLLVLALYFHRSRRRNAERKLDQWRFVINNLQENAMNDENLKRASMDDRVNISPGSNLRKGRRKKNKNKNNMREDEWQGRNLLMSPGGYDDDDMEYTDLQMLGGGGCGGGETILKCAEDDPYGRCYLSRKNSKSGKYSLGRSREGQLEDSSGIWIGCGDAGVGGVGGAGREPQRPRNKRDLRHKRAKSGQWECAQHKNAAPYTPTTTPGANVVNNNSTSGLMLSPLAPGRKMFTQSAPDLLEMVQTSIPSPTADDIYYCATETPYVVVPTEAMRNKMARSSTMGAVPPRPPPRHMGTRVSSKPKIRC